MGLSNDFKVFCNDIQLDNLDDMESTAGEIAKKLNAHYYDAKQDSSSHMYIVGSVGRGTAIKGSSDLDLLFDLPIETYKKFDNYESNGQSALIQEVKDVIIERYPNTKVRGDGQVVVIEFLKYIVELVPGFKQSDDRFKYPDTHDGGSWKYTDPIPEQEECKNANNESDGVYFDFCHVIRNWKNCIGFEFGGLLIDTLIYNHFKENDYYSSSGYDDYYEILKKVFEYLKGCNKDQAYWLAVGSKQHVHNSGEGAFVNRAKKALKQISDAEENNDDINDALRSLLGNDFPESSEAKQNNLRKAYSHFYRNTEQFIEQLVPVDIRYTLSIDCRVSQKGWRDFLLSTFRIGRDFLRIDRSLDFHIVATNCPKPYKIYWKVRNVGAEAERRDEIRGQIIQTNNDHHKEHTQFQGNHYVECYLVKNDICVARARIQVPIGTI